MLQIVNKITSTGGVEFIAKEILNNCGGSVIAFEPSRVQRAYILQPKIALKLKGQYVPVDIRFFIKCYHAIQKNNHILIHQPTLAASILSIFFTIFNKRFTIFKHARGDGFLGRIIELLCHYLIKKKGIKCIVTSKHEMKFSKLTGLCEVVNFPIPKALNKPTVVLPNKEKLTFVIIGRLVEYKGILQFINELEGIYKGTCAFRLEIIGDGPLKAKISEQSKRLSWVRLHGRTSDEYKLEILSKSCSLVVCSRSRGEAFNLTQLEALSLRKPILLRKLSSGTQDTAWNSETVIRYSDGSLEKAIKQLKNLKQEQFDSDWLFFHEKYSSEKFYQNLMQAMQYEIQ